MVGVQMEYVDGHKYPPGSLRPQNDSGSAGPENLLKIVSCCWKWKAARIDGMGPNGIGGWPPISTWIISPSLGSNGPHCVEILPEMKQISLNWVLDLLKVSWTCGQTCWMHLVNLVSLSASDSTCVDFVCVFVGGMVTLGSGALGVRSMEYLS